MGRVALETEEQYQELMYGVKDWNKELWKVVCNLLSEDVQVELYNHLRELKKEKEKVAYAFAPEEKQRNLVDLFLPNTNKTMLAISSAFGSKYVLTHLIRFAENDWYLYVNFKGEIYTVPRIKGNCEVTIFNLFRMYMEEPSLAKLKALNCPTLLTYIEDKYNYYLKEKAEQLESEMQLVLQVEIEKSKTYLKICKDDVDAWITLKHIMEKEHVEAKELGDYWGMGLKDMENGQSHFIFENDNIKVNYFKCLAP